MYAPVLWGADGLVLLCCPPLLTPLLHCSMSPEGKDLMQTSRVGLSVPRSLLSAHCPAVGLCICPPLLQEEASLMVGEQGTDL